MTNTTTNTSTENDNENSNGKTTVMTVNDKYMAALVAVLIVTIVVLMFFGKAPFVFLLTWPMMLVFYFSFKVENKEIKGWFSTTTETVVTMWKHAFKVAFVAELCYVLTGVAVLVKSFW